MIPEIKTRYTMPVFGLRNKDGEIVFHFPPQFGSDQVIYFLPYQMLLTIAAATGLEPVKVEVEVNFVPTGRINSIPSGTGNNARAISLRD